ncbi:DNA-processing protein DprA [Dechloromonas sp. ZY10]|uniref:DNA-processing protein DprA n=1 Tax=Dechloromonas aquae TaxID=2664436 RepID=UPI0035287ACB
MSDQHSLAAWLRLTQTPEIGGETQRKLLTAFGLPEAIYAAGREAVRQVIGPRADLLFDFCPQAAVDRALAWSEVPGQHIVTLADAAYPPALLQIADPPCVLYVRGQPELLQTPTLGVVGSRNATTQGLRNAEDFARTLADAGLSIASGLALGIDAAAHRGALAANGVTVAVIGTGADRMYPARNKELALAIAEHGAIVSEFPLGTPVMAHNFPRRNRIIAGLSLGVLVVEAALESGSLITARLAGEQGREVFAIPGSIHSPLARGCHRLLKQGAKLVESAADILDELATQLPPQTIPRRPAESPPQSHAAAPDTSLGEDAANLLTALGHDPCSFDELAARSGLASALLANTLLELELAGKITPLPGNRYQRLGP